MEISSSAHISSTGNQFDEDNRSSIDRAWNERNYSEVLSLLKNDSLFPEYFNLEALRESDENQKRLKVFVEDRNRFHQWIRDGKLSLVKEYVSETKLKYYFNSDDESAAKTAIINRQLEIYAYLLSANASLDTSIEIDCLDELSNPEKEKLEEKIRFYFPKNENSHIFYLISKLKVKSYEGDIGFLWEKLNEIPEISEVLKVIQYQDNLEIFLDFNSEFVREMFPLAPKFAKGLTLDKEGTIYVAGGKRKKLEVLGTMAHEFTHLAMALVFKNSMKPFREVDVAKKSEYSKIVDICKNKAERRFQDRAFGILADAFDKYKEEEHEKELIVRVTQILMECEGYGRSWLENNTPELYNFYKENIIPECQKFIDNNFYLKPRNLIRELNREEGEIKKIQNYGLEFKNLGKIENLLKDSSKDIFVFVVKNIFLGLLRIFQVAKDGGGERCLIFKLENFLSKMDEVKRAFYSEAAETLIIECPDVLKTDEESSIEKFLKCARDKENKKIIFVVKDDNVNNFKTLINKIKLTDDFEEVEDEDFSVFDLKENSQKKILENLVIFQGKEVKLRELINNDDLKKLVDSNLIVQLLEGANIEIGGRFLGVSNLEGAYSDIDQDIVLDSLVNEIKETNDIFVFKGFDKKSELVKSLERKIDVSIVEELENFGQKLSHNKKIFIKNCGITNENFQKICENNSDRKIYLIEKNSKFFLKRIYNPKFYFKREFNNTKVSKSILESNVPTTDVIIVCNSDKIKKPENINSKICWLSFKKSKMYFKKLSKPDKNVHLLNFKNGELFWVKTFGEVWNLYYYYCLEAPGKQFLTEDELVSEIVNRKIIVLADDPGMGKSSTLTSLYESKMIFDTHWVIRINLRDYVEVIQNIDTEVNDIEKVKCFLKEIDSNLSDKFNSYLLNYALCYDNFPKKLLFVFDGFDELLDQPDRKNVINLVNFLKENCECKIWITTRAQFQDVLEDEFLKTDFAITFNPITDSSKMAFIQNYVKDRLKLLITKEEFDEIFKESSDSKISIYVKSFVENLNNIFIKDLDRFIGTPLQLHLLLDGSIKSFLDWVRSEDSDPDFTYLGKDMLEVFEKFFTRKYDIYFKKKGISDKTLKKEEKTRFENCHENLAAKIYSPKKKFSLKTNKTNLLLVGIVNKKLDFLHFTFREYFFAKWLLKFLTGRNSKLADFPGYQIMAVFCDPSLPVVRTFINLMLKNFDEKKQDVRVSIKKELNDLASSENGLKNSEGSFFHVAVYEKNIYLFKFLFEKVWIALNYPVILTCNNAIQENFFQSAVGQKDDYVFDFLVAEIFPKLRPDILKNILLATDLKLNTALHLALRRNNDKRVKKIFEMIEKTFSEEEILKYLCSEFSPPILMPALDGYSEINEFLFEKLLSIASREKIRELFDPSSVDSIGINILEASAFYGYFKIFEYIFEKAESYANADWLGEIIKTFAWTKMFLFTSNINRDLINFVLKKAEGALTEDKIKTMKQDALFLIVDQNRCEIFEMLLENESNVRLKELLSSRNENGQNLFLLASHNGFPRIVGLILKKVEECLGLEFLYELLFTTDDARKTALHVVSLIFILGRGNTEIPLRGTGVKLKKEVHFRRMTDSCYTFEIILKKLPLEKQYELLNMKDQDDRIPLHYACMKNGENIVKKLFLPDTDDDLMWEKQFQLICVKDNYGNTPFHFAATSNGLNIVQFFIQKLKQHLPKENLVEYLTRENDFKCSPLDLAILRKNVEVSLIIFEAINY